MKIPLIITLILAILSCKAQQPLYLIQETKVNANITTYSLNRTGNYIKIENQKNKLSETKMIAPNLSLEMSTQPIMKVDKQKLTLICARILPLQKLQKLPKGIVDGLSIRIRCNTLGTPLEVSFLTETNSILNINELESIESLIKKEIKATYFPKMETFLIGANYINIDTKVYYKDILEVKQKSMQ
jgi:hypothetical protein